jgi:hypothetical protein
VSMQGCAGITGEVSAREDVRRARFLTRLGSLLEIKRNVLDASVNDGHTLHWQADVKP